MKKNSIFEAMSLVGVLLATFSQLNQHFVSRLKPPLQICSVIGKTKKKTSTKKLTILKRVDNEE